MQTSGNLSNLQLELIKLFKYNLNDTQLIEIKDMLSKYFANITTVEMDKLWKENNWNDETIENWKNERMRTKYE